MRLKNYETKSDMSNHMIKENKMKFNDHNFKLVSQEDEINPENNTTHLSSEKNTININRQDEN